MPGGQCAPAVTVVILPTIQKGNLKPSVISGQELSKVPQLVSGRTRVLTRSDLVHISNHQATALLLCREKLRAVGTQRKAVGLGRGKGDYGRLPGGGDR